MILLYVLVGEVWSDEIMLVSNPKIFRESVGQFQRAHSQHSVFTIFGLGGRYRELTYFNTTFKSVNQSFKTEHI